MSPCADSSLLTSHSSLLTSLNSLSRLDLACVWSGAMIAGARKALEESPSSTG